MHTAHRICVCVRWVGDLILSKSTENRIVLWRPSVRKAADGVAILQEYMFPGCDIWYMRFGLDAACLAKSCPGKTG